MNEIIRLDLAAILADGLASEIAFRLDGVPQPASADAIVSETTLGAEADVGGARLKRSFSAVLRCDALPKLPRWGNLVEYRGETFRVSQVRTSATNLTVEFSEK